MQNIKDNKERKFSFDVSGSIRKYHELKLNVFIAIYSIICILLNFVM